MTEMENAAELAEQRAGRDVIEAMLESLGPETGRAIPCPRCGKPVGVKSKHRSREVRTLNGQITLLRNYHYCERCSYGFYPRDWDLGLPEDGALSEQMQGRVLDFAVNDTFEQAAARWSVHHRKRSSTCASSANETRRSTLGRQARSTHGATACGLSHGRTTRRSPCDLVCGRQRQRHSR